MDCDGVDLSEAEAGAPSGAPPRGCSRNRNSPGTELRGIEKKYYQGLIL